MAQARCSRGHLYDPDIYGNSCPYCESVTTSIDFDAMPRGPENGSDEELGKSVPVSTITPEEIRKTAPSKEFLEKQEEVKKTQAVFTPKQGSDPVVGWLVCVKGAAFGEDYKLRGRTNTIGRNAEMDVRIRGDNTITGDTHAKIDYDAMNNEFYLLPGNNRNTIYCNRAPIYSAFKLTAYDRIQFGKSELLFVPFCNDKFVWPTDEGE